MASNAPPDFSKWKVADLKDFLKVRGVSSSERKAELVKLCELATVHNIEVDPDCLGDDIATEVLQKLNVKGTAIPHPTRLNGTNDLSKMPNIDNFDIYNYLIKFRDFSHKQLKDFTNLDGFQLYVSGYVEQLQLVTWTDDISIVKFQVKPKQRSEDPINKTPFYNGWIILDSSVPEIATAYCACKGGVDGGCRHTVAVLFEIAEYADVNKVSCTSQPCVWKKKKKNADNPLQTINELVTALPGSSRASPPTTDTYDPYPEFVPDVDSFYEGLKLLRPNSCLLLNRYKKELPPPAEIVPANSVPTLLQKLNIALQDNPNIDDITEILPLITYSDDEIVQIEEITRQQADSDVWFEFRKGMITASKFYDVARRKPTTDPAKMLKLLMEGNKFSVVPKPLAWGRKKERVARKLFIKTHNAEHSKVTFKTLGLCVSKDHVFLGASPDGVCWCKECGYFLVEIKCPWSKRNSFPKFAALDHCYEDENKVLHLNQSSYWYYQIQGQLGIFGSNLCKLVVCTTKGIKVVDVPFSPQFWNELEGKLSKFYVDHLGPHSMFLLRSNSEDK